VTQRVAESPIGAFRFKTKMGTIKVLFALLRVVLIRPTHAPKAIPVNS
jgi:hypothetical protein